MRRARGSRRRWLFGAALVMLLAAVGGALALSGSGPRPRLAAFGPPNGTAVASVSMLPSVASTESSATTATGVAVEVPDVVGRAIADAEAVLTGAGFETVRSPGRSEQRTGTVVVVQRPQAGTKASQGARVTLSCGSRTRSVPRPWVVCIDPGHQARADLRPEPIGPGSSRTKARVTGGAVGVATRVPENRVTLAVSLKLRRRLEAAGVRVVMTRTRAAVSISNRERAAVANAAHADLFVRLHADSSVNADVAGISTLYPSGNTWVRPIATRSRSAATLVQRAVVAGTAARNRGLQGRSDMSGFNWSRVPAVLVEMGFMSNPAEDVRLNQSRYQERLAAGIARGVLEYLRR